MQQSIEIMKNRILEILEGNKPSIYLFGSLVLNDFKLGWSDIDILCLTSHKISEEQTEKLVNLRQDLMEEYKGNQYFRSFEGGFLTLDAFKQNKPDRIVYWGTSGQRITEQYTFDTFSMIELLEDGKLLYGTDIRNQLRIPTNEDVMLAVLDYYNIIRKYASSGRSLYTAGWFLDIARCIYTLRTGTIIAKTEAGKWALENGIAPDSTILEKVIEIRNNPIKYKNDEETMKWLETLGDSVQQFADVLENELIRIRGGLTNEY